MNYTIYIHYTNYCVSKTETLAKNVYCTYYTYYSNYVHYTNYINYTFYCRFVKILDLQTTCGKTR